MRKGSISGRLFIALLALSSALAAVGCAPKLGDSCRISTDCSVQGDRDCDTSAPGGYCTMEDCVEGSCGEDGYCVRFEPDQIRLASSWCMARCRRGCRDGYRCISTQDLNAERCGMPVEEFRRLSDLPDREARCAPLAENSPDCAWNQLQVCLRTQPRAAEVLDSKAGAEFCGQRPIESVEEDPDASTAKAYSEG